MNQRTKLASALLAFALIFSLTAWTQETHPSKSESGQTVQDSVAHNPAQRPSANSYMNSPERFFRLTFRVLDLSPEGKVINSRAYTETIATGPKSYDRSSIRTGDRVPVGVGNTFQYIDIGTNIDADKAEIVDHTLHLHVLAHISSIPSKSPDTERPPLTRQTSWDSNVTVPVDKPTIIFSSDNSVDKGKMEMELTAVPIGQ